MTGVGPMYIEGSPVKRDSFTMDEDGDYYSQLDEAYGEEELFDTCCSICDNGGEIICCEGRCMRSFHATIDSGQGLCRTLGLSQTYINSVPNFLCQNCQYQQHQCFICGKLGSSDTSSDAEVYPCVSAGCGHFYHPKCIVVELKKRNDTQSEDLDSKVAAGESFSCPAHKCFVCNRVENRKNVDMQFAVCRRCPKSYHRKCLPSEIAFEDDLEKNIVQRAWDGLLPKRILLYCLDHEIIPGLGTPRRNHLCFPGSRNEKHVSEQVLTSANHLQEKRKSISFHRSTENVIRKTVKQGEAMFSSRNIRSEKLGGMGICGPESDDERKANDIKFTSTSTGLKNTFSRINASSQGTVSKSMVEKRDLSVRSANISCKKLKIVSSGQRLKEKKGSSSPVFDLEMERRIKALIEDVDSSFDVEEFKKTLKVASIYKNSHAPLDKNLTTGKVEVTVKAIRTALRKLDDGGSIDDAKAVCSPEMLRQIPLWKRRLDVYLGPFLHGMRYQSYGRHFTNLEKLQEVVDRLHWYVQDNDMIVDFCCGANDFSHLMKEKLDSVGKKCSFKNYDLFPSKNDFNFEQRDWFTVEPQELPTGSRLIMGLNPPFGVNGALANKFIGHAFKFRPKIIILIVPVRTKRLDAAAHRSKYDLIWEDRHLLSGKSFYLPGSIDAHDKQVSQWNNIAPPLSLWSRPDWTQTHREVARRYNHMWLPDQPPCSQPKQNHPMGEKPHCYGDFSNMKKQLPGCFDDLSGKTNQYGRLHNMVTYMPGRRGENDLGAYMDGPHVHVGAYVPAPTPASLSAYVPARALAPLGAYMSGPHGQLGLSSYNINRDVAMGSNHINVAGQMGEEATNSYPCEKENAASLSTVAELPDMDLSPNELLDIH